MAWAGVGALGTVSGGGGSQSQLVLTTSATLEANNVGVLVVSLDNEATTDGDEGLVTGVVDSAGNTWSKGGEFTNGQGTAGAGACCAVWFCKVGTQLTSGGTITITFKDTATRDTCATCAEFTIGSGLVPEVVGVNTVADDGIDPSSLDLTTPNESLLRIRGLASELNSVAAMTLTAGWSTLGVTRSRSNTAAMSVRGEFHVSTGTSDASNPTLAAADHASVYIALREATPVAGQPMAKRWGGVATAGAREGYGGDQSRRRW